jgi:putative phosphotransacetylase
VTESELDRLAKLIADALLSTRQRAASADGASSWLPVPVRPEPPARGASPPAWSGAALGLEDVAPSRGEVARREPRHRASTSELTAATRAAAAGQAPPRQTVPTPRTPPAGRPRPRGAPPLEVGVGVSNRHVHLSADHCKALFGSSELTPERKLRQPGQFAAREALALVGPSGRIDKVRVVGPARGATQVELALSDCRRLGVSPPVRASGSLAESAGGLSIVGSAGTVTLERGVIVAARHLHLSTDDARAWGLRDGDRLDIRCGVGARSTTFHDVLVRAGDTHATELHLDTDEAHAAGVHTGDRALILSWSHATSRRPLVTERDVLSMARDGRAIPRDAILTPSARDRARALDLL